jgi:hypothetical protein
MFNNKNWKFAVLSLLIVGCAAQERSCASCNAETYGADWVVVQYRYDGAPINCWSLRNVSITNEPHSDGVYWLDPAGHMVHISGWYNRVQVGHGDFATAANAVGVDVNRCTNGTYAPKQ